MSANTFCRVGRYSNEINRRALFRLYKSEFLGSPLNYELTRARLFFWKNRPEVGIAIDTLTEELYLAKIIPEDRLELVEIEFMNVERIVEMRLIRIQKLVWR